MAADDFGGVFPSGQVSFGTGEASQQVTVAVSGDTLVEADETFLVMLSNGSGGAQIVGGSAQGTILNDAHLGTPELLFQESFEVEGSGQFTSVGEGSNSSGNDHWQVRVGRNRVLVLM